MRVTDIVSGLASFERRGPGTDAERRAARWLADQVQRSGREARVEPFWCRPNWALAHVWHLALAIGGSLLAIPSPRVGGALVTVALLSIIADELTGISLGRRLTPERSSQNIVASAPSGAKDADRNTAVPNVPGPANPRTPRLILTANYDAGRTGLANRTAFRSASAALRRGVHGLTPGWLGWVVIAVLWLLVAAVLRVTGEHGQAIGVIQLPPTVALMIAIALLIDLAGASWSPAAGDNASGAAIALALTAALDAAPPPAVTVDLVLQGAGEGGGIGLRRYLHAHRRELDPADTVVIGIAAAAAGRPRWWRSDGQLLPVRYAPSLRGLCERLATDEPHLEADAHCGRGAAPALRARARRLPSIAIGSLDRRGIAPRSHQSADTISQIDERALDQTLQFGMLLADAVGAFFDGESARRPSSTPA